MNNFEALHKRDKLKIAFLPIKPVYAEKLMAGSKQFEFRRRPISTETTHIVVYASSPCKRILGIVKVISVESGAPKAVGSKTREFAGISRSEFLEYFSGSATAYAIGIDPSETVQFETHIHPKDIEPDFVVPQSFKYVDPRFLQSLLARV